MSSYVLKLSGSNQIVNTINWDGISPIYTGSFIVQPLEEFEIEFSSSLNDFPQNPNPELSHTITKNAKTFSNFIGTFQGDLTGSITINGERLPLYLDRTEYGRLTYITSSGIEEYPQDTQFIINDETTPITILMSITNIISDDKQIGFYSSSLGKISENNILKFKEVNGYGKRDYLILGSETTTVDGKEYLKLSASLQYEHLDNFFQTDGSVDAYKLNNSNWHIDFDLGDRAQVGKFYGDFFVDGEKFDETFKIAPKPCTILKYEEDVINQLPTDGGLNPQGGYFIFDKNTSLNGEYGENSWSTEKPTRIRLNLQTLGDTVQQNDYEEKLFKIIRGRLGGSEIELEQILPNKELTAAYKKFAIIRGIYRERSIRKDANREYPVRYHYLDWGSQDFVETDRYFGQEDIDYFYGDGPFGLDFSGIGTNSARDGFFELEVQQLEPLNVNPILKPEQDAEFKVCIRNKEYRREITVFETSGEYDFPEWADQITIYAVGAGGGGGGGAWGYPHKINEGTLGQSGTDQLELIGGSGTPIEIGFGYDWVVGGGGGAGGSVAIDAITREKLPYYNRKLTVMVGSAGKGGVGSDYKTILNWPAHRALYNALNQDATNEDNGLGYDVKIWTDPKGKSDISYLTLPFAKNFGKKGGDSLVYIKNTNTILVKAQGGSGGNAGLAAKGRASKIHNGNCEYRHQHRLDDDIVRYGKPFTLSLGGGGSTQESIGSTVRPGGHGGYGVATTPFYKPFGYDSDVFLGVDTLFAHKNRDMNNAPNIPWNNNSIGYLKTPMGRLNNNTYFIPNSLADIGIFDVKALSKEQPNELAPPGGGGGFGVRYHDIADDVPYSTMLVDPALIGLNLRRTINENEVNIYNPNDLSKIGPITIDGVNYGNRELIGMFDFNTQEYTQTNLEPLFRFSIDQTSPSNLELIIIPNQYSIDVTEKAVYERFTKNASNLKTIVIRAKDPKQMSSYYKEVYVLKVNGSPYLKPIPNLPSSNNLVIPIIIEAQYDFSNFYNPNSNATPTTGRYYEFILSDASWIDQEFKDLKPINKLFITPLDGLQRSLVTIKNINDIGKGGEVLFNNRYLINDTDSNGQSVQIEFRNGGNGGFAQYFTTGLLRPLRPTLAPTLPENVSNRIGVGGGGGAAVYLKQHDDKDRIGDPDVPSKGQDGADGGPGIVVIVADKYSF